jgi:hypothetical protein
VAGATGPEGPEGPAGEVGPTGPAGASEPAEYAYVFNDSAQTVPLETDITFNKNGLLSPGITHALDGAGVEFTTPGIYEVTFSVSGVEPSQMTLFLNGSPVTSSVYGSGAGTQQNTGQVLIQVASGDVLTLRNHTSASAVTLQTLAGGTQTNVNASLVIEKVA